MSAFSRRRCFVLSSSLFFFFNDTATTEIYTLSLHDALPICLLSPGGDCRRNRLYGRDRCRSEEHTSELQSRVDLVCRLLLEKKKKKRLEHNDEKKKLKLNTKLQRANEQ